MRDKNKSEAGSERVMLSYDHSLYSSNENLQDDSWLLDSGATSHMTNNKELLYNTKRKTSTIKFGNSESQESNMIGSLDIIFVNRKNEEERITLKEVTYVPSLVCNLISLPTAMNNGFARVRPYCRLFRCVPHGDWTSATVAPSSHSRNWFISARAYCTCT